MRYWSALILPAAAFAGGYAFLDVGFWEATRQGLLVALSVIGAAVLVRLARGMPFTNLDLFEVGEIRKLAKATRQVMRSLRLLIIVAFLGMFGLVIIAPLAQAITSLNLTGPVSHVVAPETASGLLACIMTYVFIRIASVIQGDYDLVELQASYMVRMVERREAKNFSEAHDDSSTIKLQPPKGYGKIIQ